MIKDGFKRINFFKGFFTQAADWQYAQEYHIEKRKFHNRFLHTPGIVYGCLDNLKVTAPAEGTSLYIEPGYAIDGEGRDLYLPKPEKLQIIPPKYNPPAAIYVIIRYDEEKIDKRSNIANPEYTDYAFIKEWPIVEITTEVPDNYIVIELARIPLSRDARRIKNPDIPDNPGPNEIDIRHVKIAGAIKGRITLEDIGERIREGQIRVAASEKSMPSEYDTNVQIEKISEADAHRFYFVSAYPVEEARIFWRIESSFTNGAVEYRLFFKNLSKSATTVHYQVYRLY